ncbi:MAG TPA: sugar ABC transporter substrate-binding protein [Limnochordia bacterium]
MKRIIRSVGLSVALAIGPSLLGISAAAGQELRFLAVGYSVDLLDYLNRSVVPAFEAKHGTKVTIEATDWNGRVDKILVSIAGGVPYDIVSTGYYSPYQEGSMGLLAPLDRYLDRWEYTDRFPAPVWQALRWRGHTYVVPQNHDLRGIAYNRALFSEAGLDPDHPPQSWEELIRATRRLTRLEGDRVAVRGFNLSRSESGSAQQFFWFMRQAGITEIDVDAFTSHLNRPEALAALQTMADIAEAARFREPAIGGGFTQGRVAMEHHSPATRARVLEENPDLIDDYGLFAPRRSPDSPPVAHGFINGLAILAASRQKDLAWEFIASLYEEETLFEIQRISGFLAGRVDMARRMTAISPRIELFYQLFAYLQPPVIPPPRNIAQQEIGKLIQRVYRGEIPPEQALAEGHALWTRLLAEWRADIEG